MNSISAAWKIGKLEVDDGTVRLNSINGDVTGVSYKVLLPMAGIVTELHIDGEPATGEIVPYIGNVTRGREERICRRIMNWL